MNPELHHKWNAARDSQRGSDAPVKKKPQADAPEKKVLLKQNKPR